MRIAVLLLTVIAAVLAVPRQVSVSHRIVGGSPTNIETFPHHAALLSSWDLSWYTQSCGGTIINNRSILTSVRCFTFSTAYGFRVRVGSTWANSGGVVHNVDQTILHPNYNSQNFDNDIAIVRLSGTITFNNQARAAAIAGPNYNVADDQPVWATGWGAASFDGPPSEQLRHFQMLTVNQATCRSRYNILSMTITDNMLCSGWIDAVGRDQCQNDSGSPLIHNGVIIGVYSWGEQCALARYPAVHVRVSNYTAWIQANA